MKLIRTMLASLVISLTTTLIPAHGIMILPITEADFSGHEDVVTFAVALNTALPFSANGANFLSWTGNSALAVAAFEALLLEDGGTLTITFDDPIRRFGLNLIRNDFAVTFLVVDVFQGVDGSGSRGLRVYGDGTQDSVLGFQGFQSDTPFRRTELRFEVDGATAFTLDDMRFENFENGPITAPEPGSASLMLIGLGGGLLLLSRRRFNRTRKASRIEGDPR